MYGMCYYYKRTLNVVCNISVHNSELISFLLNKIYLIYGIGHFYLVFINIS